MPEPTTQLTPAEVEAIAARKPHQYGTMVSLPVAERDALIRDWRALQAERLEIQRMLASTALEDATEDDDPPYSTDELVQGVRFVIQMKNAARQRTAALREQLAQAHGDNERLARVIQDIEEREAAVCPEDVGFDEYIRTLQQRLETRPQAGYPWTGNEP